jgi:hypothetical protein
MSPESLVRSQVLYEKYRREMPLHLLREAREMTHAALKRRSSTVVFAAVEVSSLQSQKLRSTSKSTATDTSVRPTRPVVEIPCLACGAVGGYGALRLRMASTSWASCFAQDDRAGGRVSFRSRSVQF